MPVAVIEAFHAWHDFYVLIGTAAATLIGAMFGAAPRGLGRPASRGRGFLDATCVESSRPPPLMHRPHGPPSTGGRERRALPLQWKRDAQNASRHPHHHQKSAARGVAAGDPGRALS